jgi:Metallo-peptidase family M12
MSSTRVLSAGAAVALFLTMVAAAFPPPAHAAWVNSAGQFQVGGQLRQITPTATSVGDPACNSQGGAKGGTSLALVQGRKVPGVDAVAHPLVLVVSCFTSNTTLAAKLNFIDPADGKVLKQIVTSIVPGTGYPHFVYRPDKGDLLACGASGALYSIDFVNATGSPLTATTTALPLPPFPQGSTASCTGLTWDAEADMIYLGLSVNGGDKVGRVIRFKEGSALLGDFAALPCTANGLAISGGVLFMSCVPNSNLPSPLSILRLDKNTGVNLGVHGTLSATGVTLLQQEPGLGDLACDPVTFHKDANGKDLFRDALWSRHGADGNGVVALEFPAFTCGLPASSVVIQNGVPFSPLAAGLSAPAALPGAAPRAACFDGSGQVIDADGDGLPDCWETSGGGIDFDGDGNIDVGLCVPVDTNGDGTTDATECANAQRKDLFVYIDYMQFHKPNPQALSQTQSVATVGVKSVREAFLAAPVENPVPSPTGISIHFQVADQPVTFIPFDSSSEVSHVNQVAFTPCTGPAGAADPNQGPAVDFDTIKASNFGTVAERTDPKALNAKRLAFRYVLFAHNLVGNPSGGSSGSGCAEVGGDDAVVTLGSFAGSVAGHTGGVGTTDQQAGTFMHEFGHLLGLEHGGDDRVNCKPNYRSIMSYSRQFAGSPIPNRRLDYSRSQDPLVLLPGIAGLFDEALLDEFAGLGADPSLGPIVPFFTNPDQVVFGPGAWSLVSDATAAPINWNRSKQGKNPSFQNNATANINDGAGCFSADPNEMLVGHDDWSNLLYRSSAAIDFAGGVRSDPPREMDKDDETAFFQAADTDGNGVGDGTDCGTFTCTHRIDIKPSFPLPKTINPGTEANITVAIFSEKETNGPGVWNVPAQVILNDQANFPLTFSVESFASLVKVNNKGEGTCATTDVPDPLTGRKDGIKDLKCQFPTSGLPTGTHFGVVSGFFMVDPAECIDRTSEDCDIRAFSGRQEVTILQ